MAVENKAAQDRPYHDEHIYPNKRLAKLHHEHLPHILGLPSCMLEGKDAHNSLQ